jgi:ferredoxin
MKGKPGTTCRSGFGDKAATTIIDKERCTNCGLCAKVCKTFTIIQTQDRVMVMPDNGLGCVGCGQCLAVCPSGAVSVNGRRLKPGDTFPLAPKKDRATPEALANLLLARRSVRNFKDQAVDKTLIEKLLAITVSCPMGVPPSDVGVIVVYGKERVQKLAGDIIKEFAKWHRIFNPVLLPLTGLFMKKCDVEMMRDFVLPATRFMIDARKEGTDDLFYHASTVLLFHASPYSELADGHIACTYAMLAAESLGLGTCMIGTVSPAMTHNKALKTEWGIPVENKVATTLILGQPAFQYTHSIRRTFASVTYK